MRKLFLIAIVFFVLPAGAADRVKVGFISTLSGPNAAIGGDIRDGFNLALKLSGGKLGGLPAEVLTGDDQLKPENAKQLVERYLRLDKVDFITGTVFSNIVVAIAPDVIAAKTFFIAPNAGPAAYSGAQCNPFFFVSSWPSEAYSEAAGEYMNRKGIKNVLFVAPNYVGGKDAATGFKRYYQGKLVDEMYTKLGQLDYAAELSQIRAAKPDALYVFLPGGMGVNFIKQFVAAGLSKDIQLVVPMWGSDQDIIRAVGDPMLGLFSTSHWSIDFDNPANRNFVAASQAGEELAPVLSDRGRVGALRQPLAVEFERQRRHVDRFSVYERLDHAAAGIQVRIVEQVPWLGDGCERQADALELVRKCLLAVL